MNNKFIKDFFDKEYNQNENLNSILSKIASDDKSNKYKFSRMIATFMLVIGIGSGMVLAGTKIYENIFKQPEKIENFTEELKVNVDDLNKVISEDEAKEYAIKEAKKYNLNVDNDNISSVEIIKNPNYDEITYHFTTEENTNIHINAITGKLTYFDIEDAYTGKELEKFTSNRDEMILVAEKKMREFGYGDEYKVSYVYSNNGDDETKSYLWYIGFSKEYDGVFNKNQNITMTIIPQINLVSKICVVDEPFENNPIIITKEEAEKIAIEKDNLINTEGYKRLDKIKTELSIERMNADVYLKENGLSNGNETKTLEDESVHSYNTYKMNGKVRKVYVVEFCYEDRPFGQTRKYYVDTTAGEIIGGEDIFDLLTY